MIETEQQWEARQRAELPEWARDRIATLEAEAAEVPHLRRQLAERDAEIARFRKDGVPGVMHEVDRGFYDLAIQERDYARTQVENRDATIAQLRHRIERQAGK